jgi:hypothetical protein
MKLTDVKSQICRKIKEILQDKIKDGKITEKWIEGCLPQEYKRKYSKSELTSLSKQVKRNAETEQLENRGQILVDTQGRKSILTNIESRNDDDVRKRNFLTDDSIEQGLNKEVSNQNGRSEEEHDDDKQVLRSEIYELRQALKRQTPILTADKISAAEIELIIPKPKYEEVTAAMENSRDSVYLTFDRSGILQRADPDTFREN